MVYKGCSEFFLFGDLEPFAKIQNNVVSTVTETIFINNSRFKQNKKYPEHPVVGIVQ